MTRRPSTRMFPNLLLALGAMASLASSVTVYNSWRIALHANAYQPARFTIREVEFGRGRQSDHRASGTIDGQQESVGLLEFKRPARTPSELAQAFPPGSTLEVWYDPSAARIRTQGRYLRVLSRSVDLEHATASAIRTTLAWNALTLAALGWHAWMRQRQDQRPSHPEPHPHRDAPNEPPSPLDRHIRH